MTKKLLAAVSGITLLITGMAFAEPETPVIDQRQTNQEQRIDQGIVDGQLSERETNRVNEQQEQVNKMENKEQSDGVMTERSELGSLRRKLAHLSISRVRSTIVRESGIDDSKLCETLTGRLGSYPERPVLLMRIVVPHREGDCYNGVPCRLV